MEVLDPDRVAELVEAAKEGRFPDAPPPPARRAPRVRTVDFSRPTKFGVDHQRRLNRATETFCQTANTRLSSELRSPLEFEVLGTSQLTWAASQSQIAPRSLLAIVELEPIGTRILLTVEQSMVLVCLECMLGGAPEAPARDRRLSELDWTLARSFLRSLIAPLSLAWEDMSGVKLTLCDVGAHDASHVASVSEPTFGTQIEVKINKQSYAIGLLVPWSAIEPVERAIAGHTDDDLGRDRDRTPLEGPMGAVPVTVRVEVGHAELSVRDILALAPGSLITFEAPAVDGVSVYADCVPIARAQAGRQGPRRAVQLTGYIEEEQS